MRKMLELTKAKTDTFQDEGEDQGEEYDNREDQDHILQDKFFDNMFID